MNIKGKKVLVDISEELEEKKKQTLSGQEKNQQDELR